MAKIHTIEALDQAIDTEIVWRKQELTTTLKLVQKSSGPAQRAHLRSSLLMLYAHWEGWVKGVSKLYIRYVNTKSFPYESLSEAFLGNALKTKLTDIDAASTPLKHNEFAIFLRTDFSKSAKLSEALVHTQSNLSSNVFFDILERLGLERRPAFALRANMIDAELVARRNSIAHGEYLDLTPDSFKVLKGHTLSLLELFTDDVRNAASTGRHLAADT